MPRTIVLAYSGGLDTSIIVPWLKDKHNVTFGGAVFQILRRFYGTDSIPFTFISDELNGVTVDNRGAVRPLHPRSFKTLSQAEEENGQSRIYLGIHWQFDKTAGIAQGNSIGDWCFDTTFLPSP